jgi:hypothetical protein
MRVAVVPNRIHHFNFYERYRSFAGIENSVLDKREKRKAGLHKYTMPVLQ